MTFFMAVLTFGCLKSATIGVVLSSAGIAWPCVLGSRLTQGSSPFAGSRGVGARSGGAELDVPEWLPVG